MLTFYISRAKKQKTGLHLVRVSLLLHRGRLGHYRQSRIYYLAPLFPQRLSVAKITYSFFSPASKTRRMSRLKTRIMSFFIIIS